MEIAKLIGKNMITVKSLNKTKSITIPETIAFHDIIAFLNLTVAVLLWSVSLSDIQPKNIADFGLLSVLPVTFYLAFAALIISFSISLYHSKQTSNYIFAFHVISLVLMIHAVPPLVYGTLRYSWAWKHLGIIDYIHRHGTVDPTIRFLNAYHNWPGFFTLNNFLSEVAGINSAITYAQWSPVFFNLLNVGALVLIFKSVTHDKRVIWFSAWLFVFYNWVGQDYFSPQAMAYFLHLVVVGAFLRWFSSTSAPEKSELKKYLFFGWLVNFVHMVLSHAAENTNIEPKTTPTQKIKVLVFITVIFLTIASSHQLTPFLTIFSLAALVFSFRSKMRFLPALLGIIAVMWIAYVAAAFAKDVVQSTIDSFGQVLNTLDQGMVDLGQISSDQRIISLIGRTMTMSLWVFALLGIVRRIINRKWDVSMIMLAFAPFAMVAVNSYGGEMIFRAYFFTIPFMTYLVARLFFPTDEGKNRIWISAAIAVFSMFALAGFLFAHFGKDRQYYFSPSEVRASQYLFSIAPENSLIVEMSHNYPGQFQNYEWYTTVPIDREKPEVVQEIIDHPEAELGRWLNNSGYAATYFIVTRSQKAAINMLGSFPEGGTEQIEEGLLNSPLFVVIYEDQDVRIFKLNEDAVQ